jgi:hypothetical protein
MAITRLSSESDKYTALRLELLDAEIALKDHIEQDDWYPELRSG